jgi:hypothetical protein
LGEPWKPGDAAAITDIIKQSAGSRDESGVLVVELSDKSVESTRAQILRAACREWAGLD